MLGSKEFMLASKEFMLQLLLLSMELMPASKEFMLASKEFMLLLLLLSMELQLLLLSKVASREASKDQQSQDRTPLSTSRDKLGCLKYLFI